MKTKMNISLNEVITVIVATTLLSIASCGARHNDSTEKEGKAKVAQAGVKPPSMDIFSASLFGDLMAINQHIKAGTDLNAKDAYGSTPLIIAATFGKTEVAKALIDAGADVNITNNDGGTALHSAAFLCREGIVKALLDNGIDTTIRNNFGSTALESVLAPFEMVKGIYEQFSRDLGPLGLKLDYEQIEKTRPVIARLIQNSES